MGMEHKIVRSSNIASIGYDKDTNRLSVKFKGSGGTYLYSDVPQHVYDNLMSAEDGYGARFHSTVKGKFKHLKVD